MSPAELKPGQFYSNGAYGRTWGVRLLVGLAADETGETRIRYKGVAGICRRKQGECSVAEFARWARHRVALHENEWKRLDDDSPPMPAGA
jgi:hypothetical protein